MLDSQAIQAGCSELKTLLIRRVLKMGAITASAYRPAHLDYEKGIQPIITKERLFSHISADATH